MARVIGIDLGTTNSCVAITEGRQTVVIPNKGGYKTTPSVVGISESGQRLIGQVAKRQALTNPDRTVFSAKRLIGRRIDSPEIKQARAIYPYQIVEGPHKDIRVKLGNKDFSLPEISSYVLAEMKRVAEEHLQETIKDAVITVPAYFNDSQRQATKDAGFIAGLNVIRIINEPTAAAIAYGFHKRGNKKIAVYDLGGGTFDFSILEIQDGVFKVLATAGDTFLGGDDFDNLLIDHISEAFFAQEQVDLRQDKMALQRLKDACEKAKCDLSAHQEIALNLPFIAVKGDSPLHLKMNITRKTLEKLTMHLVDRTYKICFECMKLAGIDKDDLDDVLLVGGQTRMPAIGDRVSNFFGRSASKQIHPDEAVAVGAAIQAHALTAKEEIEMLLLDVTPLPLGIRSAGGSFTRLIDANTTVPVSKKRIFTTVTDNQKTVRIQVYQGQSVIADENELLGEFVLSGVREAKAGEAEVEVGFHIDANGIVHVSARDVATGKEQSIVVTMSSGLTPEEMEAMRSSSTAFDVALKSSEESEGFSQKAEVLLHRLKKIYSVKEKELEAGRRKDIADLISNAPGFISQRNSEKLKILISQLEAALKGMEESV